MDKPSAVLLLVRVVPGTGSERIMDCRGKGEPIARQVEES